MAVPRAGARHAVAGRNPGPAPQPSTPTARMSAVTLGRLAWLLTVLACLVAVLILLLDGYYGYAGVTLAVAISAAINLA
jgi:hypothetical protein